MPLTHRQGQQRTKQMSPLVESLISGERADVGGIMCNDPNGLCLISKGASMNSDNDGSGVYTSLVRLASQLSPHQRRQENENPQPPPLITIETDSTSILVKEYDGHTVALKVPNSTKTSDQTE